MGYNSLYSIKCYAELLQMQFNRAGLDTKLVASHNGVYFDLAKANETAKLTYRYSGKLFVDPRYPTSWKLSNHKVDGKPCLTQTRLIRRTLNALEYVSYHSYAYDAKLAIKAFIKRLQLQLPLLSNEQLQNVLTNRDDVSVVNLIYGNSSWQKAIKTASYHHIDASAAMQNLPLINMFKVKVYSNDTSQYLCAFADCVNQVIIRPQLMQLIKSYGIDVKKQFVQTLVPNSFIMIKNDNLIIDDLIKVTCTKTWQVSLLSTKVNSDNISTLSKLLSDLVPLVEYAI